jgi:hypothetical protein
MIPFPNYIDVEELIQSNQAVEMTLSGNVGNFMVPLGSEVLRPPIAPWSAGRSGPMAKIYSVLANRERRKHLGKQASKLYMPEES